MPNFVDPIIVIVNDVPYEHHELWDPDFTASSSGVKVAKIRKATVGSVESVHKVGHEKARKGTERHIAQVVQTLEYANPATPNSPVRAYIVIEHPSKPVEAGRALALAKGLRDSLTDDFLLSLVSGAM